MSVSDCNDLESYYAGFSKSTAKALCEFEKKFIPIAFNLLYHIYEISISSVLINFLHFFILTRKPMRTSSINILMATIALFDIFASIIHIQLLFEQYSYIFFECFVTDRYGLVSTKAVLSAVKDCSRRCSTWLILYIALIRMLIIRNPLSSKYESLGEPKPSVIWIAEICTASVPISIFKSLEMQLNENQSSHDCAPNGTYYYITPSNFFLSNNGFFAKYFYIFNAFVTDIIPCILLLFVTFFLVMELLKAGKRRANINSSPKNNYSRGKTGLVFCVAIMFFIVEFPYGLSMGLTWTFINAPGFQNILNYFGLIFSLLISANTCTHFFVCLIMSSRYRNTTISVFSCGYIDLTKKIATRTQTNPALQSTLVN